ncbi:MAG TPA: hypothetical protein VF581_11895 [Flavobacterium sp.]|jgi:hypothetical protein
MKRLAITVGAFLIFGIASAQDTTYSNTTTTVSKKSERVVKKKRKSDTRDTVTDTRSSTRIFVSDSLNRSTNPVPVKPNGTNPEGTRNKDVVEPIKQ